MVYPEEEEGDGLRLPLSPVGQRGYGLDRNRRSSAEDFGSTSEEDEMVLHPLESVLKQIRDRSDMGTFRWWSGHGREGGVSAVPAGGVIS